MTVSYSLRVSEARFFSFTRLLAVWRGSIYKLLWQEVVLFIVSYYSLSLLYRLALDEEGRKTFENICLYAKEGLSVIPLSFILGFYVSLVIGRWWTMYTAIPWIDEFAQLVASNVHGEDDRGRLARRTLVRWLNVTFVIVSRAVSIPVLTRFPTLKHLQDAGLLTDEEYSKFEQLPTAHTKFWLPCLWACNLVSQLREEGRIRMDLSHRYLLERIQAHRQSCQDLISFDWISIPIVYTQVVTIACLSYFVASIFGRQFLDPSKGYDGYKVDLYFPVIATLEFFFYFGWLKVAQAILNPYGGDDDDFELNYIIDRNVQVGFSIVDALHRQIPNLEKDKNWDQLIVELPYTKSSMKYRKRRAWYGSTNRVSVRRSENFVTEKQLETTAEDGVIIEDISECINSGNSGNIQQEDGIDTSLLSHRGELHNRNTNRETNIAVIDSREESEQEASLLAVSPLGKITQFIDEGGDNYTE
ncbi:bestrophin-2a-like [Glandiceps talaboti]